MIPNIILSLHKKWIEEIDLGRKTKEFRKSRPEKGGLPLKVWGYETKADKGRGAVVNQFYCTKITEYNLTDAEEYDKAMSEAIEYGCLTKEEFIDYYTDSAKAYVWDIVDVYKLPIEVELRDFYLTKAPQSWCYCVRSNIFCDTIQCPARHWCDKFYYNSCRVRAQNLAPIIACGNPTVSEGFYKEKALTDVLPQNEEIPF